MSEITVSETKNEQLNNITDEIIFLKSYACKAFYEIGKRLIEAKKLLKHGEWLDWLSEKVEFSEATAQRFMRLAKEYDEITVNRIGITKALILLNVSPEERSSIISSEHLLNGERRSFDSLSKRELEIIIKQRKFPEASSAFGTKMKGQKNMLLKDTAEMMDSKDYKERFKAEYYQLKIRYEKLKAFCNKIEAANRMAFVYSVTIVEPKHDCPLDLLREQQRAMGEYLHALEIRAVIEGIEL